MAAPQTTLLMVKPDSFRAGVVDDIVKEVSRSEFRILDIELAHFDHETARQFYAVHSERPFYSELVEFITSGPLLAMKLSAPNAVSRLRKFIGATDPKEAAPGTIRARYGASLQQNAVHASDSPRNARRELAFFFREE